MDDQLAYCDSVQAAKFFLNVNLNLLQQQHIEREREKKKEEKSLHSYLDNSYVKKVSSRKEKHPAPSIEFNFMGPMLSIPQIPSTSCK